MSWVPLWHTELDGKSTIQQPASSQGCPTQLCAFGTALGKAGAESPGSACQATHPNSVLHLPRLDKYLFIIRKKEPSICLD